MDVQVWEKTIVAWLNTLSTSTPIRSISQVNECFLKDIIKKFESEFDGRPVEFLRGIFPNLSEFDSFTLSLSIDCLCFATLMLIYVAFSKSAECEGVREVMCTRLDNSIQAHIAEFLMGVQEQEDIFSFSLKTIKEEIFNFVKRQTSQTSVVGDSVRTPIKSNVSNSSFDSPLQGFFQTPKRSQPNKQMKGSHSVCGDGDHLKLIKKLTNQLVEEELDKASLQEQLNVHIQKCNEYETKLRNKIEEINDLKSEWENESKKNETEIKSLKSSLFKKLEDEKKLKNELSHLENFVSTTETDLSDAMSKNVKLERQIKAALEKCAASESQLRETTELNIQLQNTIEIKEKELSQLREYYINFYNDEQSIDLSYMDRSFDKSVCPPENMGVVVDKLLRDKITENNSLKETIEELQGEKNSLLETIKSLNEELSHKDSIVSELQYLNKELSTKMENFDTHEAELHKAQQELIKVNSEMDKIVKDNSQLIEKCNILSIGLQECEQNLVKCKNSKMLLYINFLKLAEEFKAAQQRLEYEVKNISKLNVGTDEEVLLTDGVPINEVKDTIKCKYEAILNSLPSLDIDRNEELTKTALEKTCDQLNDNIILLKGKISEFEERQKRFSEEKIRLDEQLRESQEKIREIETAHSAEIMRLKEELREKENKIKELEDLILESKKIQETLMNEKQMLKQQSALLASEANRRIHEGGDYKASREGTSTSSCSVIERKISEHLREQELNDSLEEVPVCNKTFDIVNLEDKNIADRTFSIKKEDLEPMSKTKKSTSAWTVSPPSKVPLRVPSKEIVKAREPKRIQGESWVVPIARAKSKEKTRKLSASVNDMRMKNEVSKAESSPAVTKSSSLSSIIEIDYSPPSKTESKSSTSTAFFSATTVPAGKETGEKVEGIPQRVSVKNFGDGPETHNPRVNSAHLNSPPLSNFTLVEKHDDPLKEIFNRNLKEEDSVTKIMLEGKIGELQREVLELSTECDRLRSALSEAEQKRRKDKETFERNQDIIRQNITAKYESQLEHLKHEMKQLYNRELAKHKTEQSSLNSELREQNKRYKEHIDELRNQLWDLGEKLLEEQTLKRDLERNYNELKKKFESMVFYKEFDSKSLHGSDIFHQKETPIDEAGRSSTVRQIPNATFPTIPTEDEDEVFDNRFLEDMKTGVCKTERPEGRLLELQYRNSLCLPHLKSSYPGETQFHNPSLYKESDLKLGMLPFGQESLTDSDHSMTKSLLPESKGKKKEQTSYKRPGPPTPSKNGGRLSIQSGDLRLTPRNVLKELNDQNERNKGTPNPLKALLSSKNVKTGSLGIKDENTAPVTPRKKIKFFRKPFGARDH